MSKIYIEEQLDAIRNSIPTIPSSLPANGGNADTVKNRDVCAEIDNLKQQASNGISNKQAVVDAIDGKLVDKSGLTTANTGEDYAWWITNKLPYYPNTDSSDGLFGNEIAIGDTTMHNLPTAMVYTLINGSAGVMSFKITNNTSGLLIWTDSDTLNSVTKVSHGTDEIIDGSISGYSCITIINLFKVPLCIGNFSTRNKEDTDYTVSRPAMVYLG